MTAPSIMVRLLSRKQAAQELGISRQRVEQLLKRWPETECDDGIDIAALTELRTANADPLRQSVYNQHRKLRALSDDQPAPARPEKPLAKPAPDNAQGVLSFTDARTKRERANAEIAELKLAEQSGRLISREVVHAREYGIARDLRDRIAGFPTRMQQFLPADAMQMLTEECEKLVRELQERAARIAEEDF